MKAVFFLGSHRTGTKALAGFFRDNFDNVSSYHQVTGHRLLNILSTMYVENFLSETLFESFVRLLVVRRIRKLNCKIFIEANGFDYVAAKIVKKHITRMKIIHIIRDPRDFVSSYLNLTHTQLKNMVAKNLIPFWNVSGHLAGEMSKAEWKNMSEFEQFCWLWRYKNQKILELYSHNKDDFFSIRFEDLIASKEREIHVKEVLRFIGLPYKAGCENYFNKKQNAGMKTYFPDWRDWDAIYCKKLNVICGSLMKKYNYGLESEWIGKTKFSENLRFQATNGSV